MEKNNVPELVTELLKTRTYLQLAIDIGVVPQTIQTWKKGTWNPSEENLKKLLKLKKKGKQ